MNPRSVLSIFLDEGQVPSHTETSVKRFNPGFPFSILIHSRTDSRGFANAKFEPEFGPKGPFHYVSTDQLSSHWPKAPETGVFPTELSDTYPFAPYPSPKFAVLCKPPILLATAASQFSAACSRKAAASDGSPPAPASSNART